jgi:hypothetical protein
LNKIRAESMLAVVDGRDFREFSVFSGAPSPSR